MIERVRQRLLEDKTVTQNGDYNLGPRLIPEDKSETFRVEGCFSHPSESFRLRVVILMKRVSDNSNLYDWKFESVEVHKVRRFLMEPAFSYIGPYTCKLFSAYVAYIGVIVYCGINWPHSVESTLTFVFKEAYISEFQDGLDVEDYGRVAMKLGSKDKSPGEVLTGIWAISSESGFLVDQDTSMIQIDASGSR